LKSASAGGRQLSLLRWAVKNFDCEIFVEDPDGKCYRWESVVAASDITVATQLAVAHSDEMHCGCRVTAINLSEIDEHDPIAVVETPSEGVFAINDHSEVVTQKPFSFKDAFKSLIRWRA